MKRLFCLFLALLTVFPTFVGCDFGETPAVTTAATTEAITGPSTTTKSYLQRTVKLNNQTKGVKILGVRNLSSNTSINCDWGCSGIEINVDCKETVTFNVKSSAACYFRAYVDGAEYINDADNTPYFTVNGSAQISLEMPWEGVHNIKLMKVTGYTIARAEITSMVLKGTLLEERPADNDYYIEFVGDSITCGWGTIGEGGETYKGQDGTVAYPYLVAQAQKADYSMTALSGQGLLCGTPGMTVGYKYACWHKEKTTSYNFARKANLVVINIGTNDYYKRSSLNISTADFKASYKDFLNTVKEKNGADCKILCLYNAMNDTFGSTIVSLCNELGGEANGYYSYKLNRASGSAVSSGHPTIAENAAYADALNPIITSIRSGS